MIGPARHHAAPTNERGITPRRSTGAASRRAHSGCGRTQAGRGTMKGIARVGFCTLLCLSLSLAAYAAGDAAKPVTLAPDQLKWEVPAGSPPGVTTAMVWGDMTKGAHGAFHKAQAGFSTPLHTHSSNNKIVVLAGTMAMAGEDGKEMKFPAGSFYTQPNTFKHTTKCLPGAECLVYLEADAAWDLKLVAAK
jgi:hypothetical protein